MRRPPGPLLASLTVACLATSCVGPLRARQADLVGQAAPALVLKTFDGRSLRLVEKGQPTLLVFLASWCAPCRAEADRLVDLERRFHPRGLRIVGVAIDEPEGPDAVRRFAEERGINFPIVMGTSETSRAYGGTPVTPTAFLVGKEGRIEGQVVGMREMSYLESAVERLIDG